MKTRPDQPGTPVQADRSPQEDTPRPHSAGQPSIRPGSIVIVTVTKTEAQAVLEVFSTAAGKKCVPQEIENRIYYNLHVHGGVPVFMIQSEMGNAPPGGALLTVHNAIEALRPQAMIMCGIAFGLRPDKQKLGEILVARQIVCYEPQKVERRMQISRGDRTTCSERLLNRFRSGDNDWRGVKTHFGPVMSGEKLVNSRAFRNRLLEEEPEAIGGEMEGAGLYAAAREAKVDWILVKGICDWADGKKNDADQAEAARNAAQFVLHVVCLCGWGQPEEIQVQEVDAQPVLDRQALIAQAGHWFGALEDDQVRDCCRQLLRQDGDDRLAQSFLDILAHAHEIEAADVGSQAAQSLDSDEMLLLVGAVKQVRAACDRAGQDRADRALAHLKALAIARAEGAGPAAAPDWRRVAAEAADYRPSALRWLTLNRVAPQAESAQLAAWLQDVGLAFNPFGYEAAEMDPYLPHYGVGAVFEPAWGKWPMVVWGGPGCGKTGAALQLMAGCVEPLDRPHEEYALPVYYEPPGDTAVDARAHVQAATRMAAQRLAEYILHREVGFLGLSSPRRQAVAELLSWWAGTAESLRARLHRAGPAEGTSPRLIREILALYRSVPPSEMQEDDYLDLLAGAMPAGVRYIYLLADVPGHWTGLHAGSLARSMNCLLDLARRLASRSIYLKLFLPVELHKDVTVVPGCREMTLCWKRPWLMQALQNRFRWAGGECLAALCTPPDPDLDNLLLSAANGSPRGLVHTGNALLEEHVRRSGQPSISSAWARQFLAGGGRAHE